MSTTSPRVRRSVLRIAALAGALTLAGAVVFAQADAAVPRLLAQILEGIGLLQADVDDLQSDVSALGEAAASPVRATASVFFNTGVMDCAVTNVADAARFVRIEMVNSTTGAVVTSDSGAIAIPPSRRRSVGVFSSAFTGGAFCRFTVLDGTGADIRANLVIGRSAADDTTALSIAAE
jgi:hypothetical protein